MWTCLRPLVPYILNMESPAALFLCNVLDKQISLVASQVRSINLACINAKTIFTLFKLFHNQKENLTTNLQICLSQFVTIFLHIKKVEM